MTNPLPRQRFLLLSAALLSALVCLAGCKATIVVGSGGKVTTSISDPPLCSALANPTGGFSNVWITVTKVVANTNAGAGPSDSGWVTLLDLTNKPVQVDVLNAVSTTCILDTLGLASDLPAGDYQQIRLYLLGDGATPAPSPNVCGPVNFFNCFVNSTGAHELLLSSSAESGLKIPSGQIAGGKLTIKDGQSTDLNINFNSCASIVAEANGQFRLEPVLSAGEVSLNQNGLSGRVTQQSGTPIVGAIVLLETQSLLNGTAVDTPVFNGGTLTASDGSFVFCPLSGGPYDVVVAAQTTAGGSSFTFNPTVIFNVPVGTALSPVTLVAEGGGPATLSGVVSTDAGSIPVNLYALQSAAPSSGSALDVTIPVFTVNPASLTNTLKIFPLSQPPQAVTAAATVSNACGAGVSNCFGYFLQVSASGPQVYTFSSGSLGSPVPPASTTSATYSFTATAPDCANPPSPAFLNGASSTSGSATSVAAMSFTGCTPPQ